MKTVIMVALTFLGYLIAYHTYGRFLSRRIFGLSDDEPTPATTKEDGVDFVPTRKGIIFGHHYTSIAGTGPIVGPAIGIIWGWVPAMVWVFVGSIVMGAVHDLGAVVLSMQNEGKSISECAARLMGPRLRYAFFLIVFLLLLIVIAIFGIVISAVFSRFPTSVLPVWTQIPIAVALGWVIYKRNGNVILSTTVAVCLMYVTVLLGRAIPLSIPGIAAIPPTGVWVIILLIYAFIASTLPVTTLLQPRDYINAWQLFIAMGLMVAGLVAAGMQGKLTLVAPAFNPAPTGAPPLAPFLFITIACGAISGFHALVGSGTTSKQIARQTDATFVGYGSMLMEAALATIVIVAVAAGIGIAYETADGVILTGTAAWQHHYSSWAASQGLGSKLTAVVVGSANMMESIRIPRELGIVIIGVFIASFAGTTLDTATRIQRYVVAEIAGSARLKFLTGRYAATAFAVATAAGLAFATGADGKGALRLWPMFGAVNQLLAALVLLLLTNHLARRGGPGYLLTAFPTLFMLTITLWAIVLNEVRFVIQHEWLLAVLNGAVFILALWIVIEGLVSLAPVLRGKLKQRHPQ